MSDAFFPVVTLLSALGCGLVAGIFFAFSTFVMRALARLPGEQGIAAMQSINVVVINPVFLLLFLGTAAACVGLLFYSFFLWSRPGSGFLLAGALLYLVGTLLVTLICNVPRNNALAGVDPSSVEGLELWTRYLSSWTMWNHVRTVAALAAAAMLSIGLVIAVPRN